MSNCPARARCRQVFVLGAHYFFRFALQRSTPSVPPSQWLCRAHRLVRWLNVIEASAVVVSFIITAGHEAEHDSIPDEAAGVMLLRLCRVVRLLRVSSWKQQSETENMTAVGVTLCVVR